MRIVKIDLTMEEWLQIIERVEDDDFYHTDDVAQNAIRKIRETLAKEVTAHL